MICDYVCLLHLNFITFSFRKGEGSNTVETTQHSRVVCGTAALLQGNHRSVCWLLWSQESCESLPLLVLTRSTCLLISRKVWQHTAKRKLSHFFCCICHVTFEWETSTLISFRRLYRALLQILDCIRCFQDSAHLFLKEWASFPTSF